MTKNTVVRWFFTQVSIARAIPLFVCVILILGSILVPAQQLLAAGNTYYVAKYGADTNPGTESKPWLTLNKAAKTAMAGDTVYFREGTWTAERLNLTTNSGAEGNPIVFKNYPGESPVFDGIGLADPGYFSGIINISKSYVHLEGIEIRNEPEYMGVLIYRGGSNSVNNVTLKDLVIHDCPKSGIWAYAVHSGNGEAITNLTIDGCEIFYCNSDGGGSDENISLSHVDDSEVKNCHIHDNLQEGIDLKLGCNNNLVHHNHVEDSPAVGIYLDGIGYAQSGNKVCNNLVHECHTGMAQGDEAPNHLQKCSWYNNIIWGCTQSGFANWGAYPADNTIELINNTFYHNGSQSILLGNSSEYYINCVVRNNLIVAEDNTEAHIIYHDYARGGVVIDHNLFYSNEGYNRYNQYGTDYVYNEDPLLNNPTIDFTLRNGSPAIDTGSLIGMPSDDYFGTSRLMEVTPDIGAYEYEIVEFTQVVEAEINEPVITDSTDTSDSSDTGTVPSVYQGSDGQENSGTATAAGSSAPAPEVYSCSPNSAYLGERLTVSLYGGNFQNGATVDFGTKVSITHVIFVNEGQLDVIIRVNPSASIGSREVTVTNPDGQNGTLAEGFYINIYNLYPKSTKWWKRGLNK